MFVTNSSVSFLQLPRHCHTVSHWLTVHLGHWSQQLLLQQSSLSRVQSRQSLPSARAQSPMCKPLKQRLWTECMIRPSHRHQWCLKSLNRIVLFKNPFLARSWNQMCVLRCLNHRVAHDERSNSSGRHCSSLQWQSDWLLSDLRMNKCRICRPVLK